VEGWGKTEKRKKDIDDPGGKSKKIEWGMGIIWFPL